VHLVIFIYFLLSSLHTHTHYFRQFHKIAITGIFGVRDKRKLGGGQDP